VAGRPLIPAAASQARDAAEVGMTIMVGGQTREVSSRVVAVATLVALSVSIFFAARWLPV
jgi:ABC-type tungstate transport system substrate-binding protein